MTRRDVLQSFVVNLLITVVIAVSLAYNYPQYWFTYLYTAFIFANCIGFTISILVHYIGPRLQRLSSVKRAGSLLVIFLFGGIFGTEAALVILNLAFGIKFDHSSHILAIQLNLIFAVVFGSVAVLYFSLRERAKRLGAALKEKELNEERLTRLKTKAELEALQTKVNPHFLFNTLNSIASLISENPKVAEETVEKLSELFRHSLKHTEKETVKLQEELNLIRTYLEIEKVRLGDRLRYEVRCEERVREVEIPAMLIQPLVENSIKHGISPVIDGGTIMVEARQKDEMCVISVRDSGKGFQSPGDAGGFGLRSIQDRLRLIYGEKASLEIVQNGDSEILINLPLK